MNEDILPFQRSKVQNIIYIKEKCEQKSCLRKYEKLFSAVSQ